MDPPNPAQHMIANTWRCWASWSPRRLHEKNSALHVTVVGGQAAWLLSHHLFTGTCNKINRRYLRLAHWQHWEELDCMSSLSSQLWLTNFSHSDSDCSEEILTKSPSSLSIVSFGSSSKQRSAQWFGVRDREDTYEGLQLSITTISLSVPPTFHLDDNMLCEGATTAAATLPTFRTHGPVGTECSECTLIDATATDDFSNVVCSVKRH